MPSSCHRHRSILPMMKRVGGRDCVPKGEVSIVSITDQRSRISSRTLGPGDSSTSQDDSSGKASLNYEQKIRL
jgi:hypothetical protein